MAQYSIKDAEMISGVKAHTLRIWEQRYEFIKPQRTDTNIRFYSDEQMKLLLNISTLVKSGMRISKVAELNDQDLCKKVLSIVEKDQRPDTQIDALVYAMIEFNEARFDKVLTDTIINRGFENTFSSLIMPFMIKVGTLWTIGSIHPAQEHFISNLIRRKIITAIDGVHLQLHQHSKRFILFLPEREQHELLLLFSEYIIRKHSHQVFFIGSTPYPELKRIYEQLKPNFLVTYLTLQPIEGSTEEYLSSLSKSFPDIRILAGGIQLQHISIAAMPNVSIISSEADLINAISR